MEVLANFASESLQQTYLRPLLEGKIRSCFAMTEPAVASSDATNIEARIERTPDGYIVNGRKWWTSGAMDPRCKVAIFMGKTDPTAPVHRQQSMVVVPMDAPGVRIVRALKVFGYNDAPHGHAEVEFVNVVIPRANLLLGEGRGFDISQARLGPGRIHHCMRLVGIAERALEIMAARIVVRSTFGSTLSHKGTIEHDLAESRSDIDQARLLTMQTAASMDTLGNKHPRSRQLIAMIKVIVPAMTLRVVDRAIQAHGGLGVCQDTVLPRLWSSVRTLRIADGPDEVHRRSIAQQELQSQRARL
jgi:acyl-CoA dehydrogenase